MPAVSASLFSNAFRTQDILQEQGGIKCFCSIASERFEWTVKENVTWLDLKVYVQVAQPSILTN